MLVRIVMPDAWPLPWYLRRFTRVGYWKTPPDDCDAPLVIADPELADDLAARMKSEYQTEYYGVRPTVHLLVFVRRDLWDAFMKTRAGTRAP
jgi:predicted membrane-bound mannosyltransferase